MAAVGGDGERDAAFGIAPLQPAAIAGHPHRAVGKWHEEIDGAARRRIRIARAPASPRAIGVVTREAPAGGTDPQRPVDGAGQGVQARPAERLGSDHLGLEAQARGVEAIQPSVLATDQHAAVDVFDEGGGLAHR